MEARLRTFALALLFTSLALAACNRPRDAAAAADAADEHGAPGKHGRYEGIGLYRPDQMWTQIVRAQASPGPEAASGEPPKTSPDAAATLKDDEEVIVVVDTKTGELRQCGNLSGFCVGMNPWAKPLDVAQNAPLSLIKHAEELAAEAAARSQAETDANNRAMAKAMAAAKKRAGAKANAAELADPK